jgi:hypothetical protein
MVFNALRDWLLCNLLGAWFKSIEGLVASQPSEHGLKSIEVATSCAFRCIEGLITS